MMILTSIEIVLALRYEQFAAYGQIAVNQPLLLAAATSAT